MTKKPKKLLTPEIIEKDGFGYKEEPKIRYEDKFMSRDKLQDVLDDFVKDVNKSIQKCSDESFAKEREKIVKLVQDTFDSEGKKASEFMNEKLKEIIKINDRLTVVLPKICNIVLIKALASAFVCGLGFALTWQVVSYVLTVKHGILIILSIYGVSLLLSIIAKFTHRNKNN